MILLYNLLFIRISVVFYYLFITGCISMASGVGTYTSWSQILIIYINIGSRVKKSTVVVGSHVEKNTVVLIVLVGFQKKKILLPIFTDLGLSNNI